MALESSASFPISSATTAKPFPASPALAASMEALSDRRLVCSDIAFIVSVIPVISSTDFAVARIRVVSSFIVSFNVFTLFVILTISSLPLAELLRVSLHKFLTSSALLVSAPDVDASSVAAYATSSIEAFISFKVMFSLSIESPWLLFASDNV